MSSQHIIDSAISEATGKTFVTEQSRSVGGGSINLSAVICSGNSTYFLKTNHRNFADMFEAEADGLRELGKPGVIAVPDVICTGETNNRTFIVMECISMGSGLAGSAEALGSSLAELHKVNQSQFGWFRDNTIGATKQINTESNNWIDFYREHRLLFQLSLAQENGYGGELQKLGLQLCDNLESFFLDYSPAPSLLHGDLWSGNYSYTDDGRPVIFDPAVYYGDREADIAMTELFGGFSPVFYQAYNDVSPLDEGYQIRITLYNLYHILNHLNLFGSGYHSQSVGMMKQLLAEL